MAAYRPSLSAARIARRSPGRHSARPRRHRARTVPRCRTWTLPGARRRSTTPRRHPPSAARNAAPRAARTAPGPSDEPAKPDDWDARVGCRSGRVARGPRAHDPPVRPASGRRFRRRDRASWAVGRRMHGVRVRRGGERGPPRGGRGLGRGGQTCGAGGVRRGSRRAERQEHDHRPDRGAALGSGALGDGGIRGRTTGPPRAPAVAPRTEQRRVPGRPTALRTRAPTGASTCGSLVWATRHPSPSRPALGRPRPG